jgi:preprotein translocase subunit SecG
MYIAIVVFHVLASFAIIGIVLLQAGKGADIGSAFGGAGSQAVFGSMGTPTILGKITGVVAVVFTITSFTLALLGGERSGSVVREPAPASAPAPSAPSAPAPSGPASAPAQSAPQPQGAPAPPSAPPAEKSK